MKTFPMLRQATVLAALLLTSTVEIGAQTVAVVSPAPAQPPGAALILTIEGRAEFARVESDVWKAASTNQTLLPGDRFRTAARSRATLRLSNRSVLRVNESTTLAIRAPGGGGRPLLDLRGGSVFMLDRENPSSVDFRTRLASGAVRGTEFVLSEDADGVTRVAVLEGAVDLSGVEGLGSIALGAGEQAVVEAGKSPRKSAVVSAVGLVQWALHYPGVLDADELGLSGEAALAESLAAYRAGDLLGALEKYPAGRSPGGDAEKAYFAGLLLAVGQVESASAALAGVRSPHADAVLQVIAAVRLHPFDRAAQPTTTGEWIAKSYHAQSQLRLEDALQSAKSAAAKSPNSGFAHARVAELEFSFGRVDAAWAALEKSLKLAHRNAEAHSLKGFLLAAKGRIGAAEQCFNEAIALDPSLGNAWLGRGLTKIRAGAAESGRQDLQTAAVLEPHRSLNRSYLGKAFSNAGDEARAARELEQAAKLDPNDPTPLLYRSLLNRQRNRINEAVGDLEQSLRLNDNRAVHRSRLLLDEDRAVRGANLAAVYQDAGMTDVALREAVRAVTADYGSHSSHLFLANAHDSLRDPRGSSLRHETPWLSEYLLANLLAPPGAGAFSSRISQEEYGRFFDRDGAGFSSQTEYWSRGDWAAGAAQYGTFGGTSWNLEGYYRNERGQVPNADLEHRTLSLQIKQRVTLSDGLYLQAVHFDGRAGDTTPYYNPARAIPGLRLTAKQEPLLIAGWHHEWSPGSRTLFLFNRLHDDTRISNPSQQSLLVDKFTGGAFLGSLVTPFTIADNFRSRLEIYSAEAQHIIESARHRTIFGARYQTGHFDTTDTQNAAATPTAFQPVALPAGWFAAVPNAQNIRSDFQRFTTYGYHHWRVADPLWLIAGVSYDEELYPVNIRIAPLSAREERKRQVSPKAGAVWTPLEGTTVRGGYAQFLGGVSFDQSFQLEPSQVAGFSQSLRGVIPDAVSGPTAGGRSEMWGVSLEQKFRSRTYLGVAAEMLRTGVDRELGVYDMVGFPMFPFSVPLAPSTTPERLDYRERSLTATWNQLLGDNWSLGARHRVSLAELTDTFPALGARMSTRSTLQHLTLNAAYTHRCGFFSRLEGEWFRQGNVGFANTTEPQGRPGDNFWQMHAFTGYRFKRRAAEVQVGVLNLTDQNYRLEPLNIHREPARERTVYASLKFHF